VDLDAIQRKLREFAHERDWDRYHSPKDLSMAVATEAGELMEIFQWIGSDESRNVVRHPEQLLEVRRELADVCINAFRLADILEMDLESAVWR
tara:strand:+ start:392 stop:670 length:279 start_codon:yes stop_codon:yes gene_type:complete